MIRKIIQVATTSDLAILALCNDGTLFSMLGEASVWYEMPVIPQGDSDDPIIRLQADRDALAGKMARIEKVAHFDGGRTPVGECILNILKDNKGN